MNDDHIILGIHIGDRLKKAVDVQKVFTEYGCNIKTRLGLHEVSEKACSPNGLVLLELCGDDSVCNTMASKLAKVEGVEVQKMVFDHP